MKRFIKHTNLLIITIISVVFFTSCEDKDTFRFPELENGGFVKFVDLPEFKIGADPLEASFSALTEDPNDNVASYNVRVKGNFTGAPSDTLNFRSTTTFPFDVSFSSQDMADLFGVDIAVFEQNDSFEFFGDVTTVDGRVYYGARTIFNVNTGEWNYGDTALNVSSSDNNYTLLQAWKWKVRFTDPN